MANSVEWKNQMQTSSRVFGLLALASLIGCGLLDRASSAAEPAYSLVQQWQVKELQHQSEAADVFIREDYVYIGGGGTSGKIAKVNLKTGAVAWSTAAQTYQPSYPVSNGRVVVYGTYHGVFDQADRRYKTFFHGLDDQTGKLLWTIPAQQQNMTGACFSDDLALIASYDQNLYALDWAKGEVRWKSQVGRFLRSTPCVLDDKVVVGCPDGNLYCLDRKTGRIDSRVDCGGRIDSNPAVANGLIFIVADDQNYGIQYDSSKAQKRLLVIDMREKRIIATYATENTFSRKIVVSGNEVYFYDRTMLYSYDSRRRTLSWQFKVPALIAPYPVFVSSEIILPMNYLGHHGEHSSKVLVLSRQTGKELLSRDSGGIGIGQAHYVQREKLLVTVDRGLTGYRIESAP